MVLDFLKKILGKKEEEVPVPRETTVNFENLDDFLEKELSSGEAEDLQQWMELAEKSKKEAMEYLEELEEFQFKEGQVQKMKNQPFYNQVLKTRPIYIRKLREILGEIKPHDDITEFHRTLSKALKLIQRTQLNQGKKLVASFEKFIININTPLNKLLEVNTRIQDYLETKEKNQKLKEEIQGLKEEIKSDLGAPDDQEKAKGEIEEKIQVILTRIEELKIEVNQKENGAEYSEFKDLKLKLKEKEDALRVMNLSPEISVDPYKRCLKKYNKLIQNKKVPGDMETSEKLLADNLKAFQESGCEPVGKILQEVERLILDGSIDLKEKEKERTLASIKEYNPGKISEIIEKIASLRKEIEDLKKKINFMDTDRKIEGLKGKIKDLEKENVRYVEGLENVDHNIKKKNEDLNKKKEELSSLLSEIHGAEVRVLISRQE